MASDGRLITIEGIDGAGKTTLALDLNAALTEHGIDVRTLREPGGVAVAERVRDLVKDPALRIGARAEALLYAAARAQLVEEAVAPLLDVGTWVLLDRFVDSSLAYQGAGRALGIDAIASINEFATGGLIPDRTLLLIAQPADRLEREEDAFFGAIASAYLAMAEQQPERIRRIDGSQPPDRVLVAALREIADLL
jgi:dTMP kinase